MDIREGDTTSCGCYQRDVVINRSTTHGMARRGHQHKGYQAWCSMKARCDPDGQFAECYADRGITVCDRWHTFELFWEDMGAMFRRGLTLERVDNDKGYEPGNCIWATHLVQGNNTRRNRWIDTPRGRMTVAQASREFDLNYQTLRTRLGRGLTGPELFA